MRARDPKMLCDTHARVLSGVSMREIYGNMKPVVATVLTGTGRALNRRFLVRRRHWRNGGRRP